MRHCLGVQQNHLRIEEIFQTFEPRVSYEHTFNTV